ncbi:hypothetical protein TNCV_4550631 [Trichonephila clavipes]|nr:hypothetical protein TNCV_4550631 [Trichonephila clavipes]
MDWEKKKRSVTYLFRMSTDPMGSRGDPPPSNRVDVRFLSSDVRGQIMEMKPKAAFWKLSLQRHDKSPSVSSIGGTIYEINSTDTRVVLSSNS